MKINVNLYGGKGIFGGRETPLEADEIYCDRAEECTFYKENKCLRCRSFLSPTCKFGRNNIIKGYTSRAMKYYEFKSKYQKDDVYNKLSYPKKHVAIIGDMLYLYLVYPSVRKKTDTDNNWYEKSVDGYIISSGGLCSVATFIPLEDVTNDLLHAIFSFHPTAIMGGVIKDYQERVVPEIIQDMKTVTPDMYKSFITAYPQYDREPNYIGKKVYIDSLKPGTKFKIKGVEWTYDGEYVSAEHFDIGLYSPWFDNGAKHTDVKIKVNDKMLVAVDNNSMVDENTRFE